MGKRLIIGATPALSSRLLSGSVQPDSHVDALEIGEAAAFRGHVGEGAGRDIASHAAAEPLLGRGTYIAPGQSAEGRAPFLSGNVVVYHGIAPRNLCLCCRRIRTPPPPASTLRVARSARPAISCRAIASAPAIASSVSSAAAGWGRSTAPTISNSDSRWR